MTQHSTEQGLYGAEQPCNCAPGDYCHWQCLCEQPTSEVQASQEGERKINISSGEDAFVYG